MFTGAGTGSGYGAPARVTWPEDRVGGPIVIVVPGDLVRGGARRVDAPGTRGVR